MRGDTIEIDKNLQKNYHPITSLNRLTLFDNHSSASLRNDLKLTKKTTDTRLFQHFQHEQADSHTRTLTYAMRSRLNQKKNISVWLTSK